MKRILLPIYNDVDWDNQDINIENLEYVMKSIYKNKFIPTFRYIIKLYSHYEVVLREQYKTKYRHEGKSKINSIEKYQSIISNLINSCNDNLISISSTHLSTYYTLKSLNVRNKKISVICFDMHADTCSALRPAWKGNVFAKLLEENIIYKLIIVSNSKLKKFSNKNVAVFNFSLKSENKIKKYILSNGVKSIYISFDIDSLNTFDECLTAMEYNSYNTLKNLSMINLNDIKSVFDLYNAVKKTIKIPNAYGYKNLYKCGFQGVACEQIINMTTHIIDFASKSNISIGVKNSNGGKVVGDVVEYYGYDFKNKTIDCINYFINEIERSVKK